jgi:dipeptidase
MRRLFVFVALVIPFFALILGVHSHSDTSQIIAQDENSFFVGGCTSIMAGRLATADGSVITSHTCDGMFRTWLTVSPHRTNDPDSKNSIYQGRMRTKDPLDQRYVKILGEIPETTESYSFLDTAYPCINEHQLAIGETTIIVRKELRNLEGGILHIEEIQWLRRWDGGIPNPGSRSSFMRSTVE